MFTPDLEGFFFIPGNQLPLKLTKGWLIVFDGHLADVI